MKPSFSVKHSFVCVRCAATPDLPHVHIYAEHLKRKYIDELSWCYHLLYFSLPFPAFVCLFIYCVLFMLYGLIYRTFLSQNCGKLINFLWYLVIVCLLAFFLLYWKCMHIFVEVKRIVKIKRKTEKL